MQVINAEGMGVWGGQGVLVLANFYVNIGTVLWRLLHMAMMRKSGFIHLIRWVY
jgi:hypothetical protein